MSRRKNAEALANDEPQTIGGTVDQVIDQAQTAAVQPPPQEQPVAPLTPAAPQQAGHQVSNATPERQPGEDVPESPAKKWVPVKGYWRDNWKEKDRDGVNSGVRIEADTRNNLNTIIFNERPPRAAIEILEANGFVEDERAGGYSRRMHHLHKVDDWKQADEVVVEVANVLRQAKGMEPIDHFYISQRKDGRSPF